MVFVTCQMSHVKCQTMFIQLIIIIFVLFALSRVFIRYSKSEITSREVWMWSIFWFLVITATLWPKSTDIVARWVGVGRGADLLVYVSIMVLFFIVFKILVKVEKIDRDVTRVVRKWAIEEKEEEIKK